MYSSIDCTSGCYDYWDVEKLRNSFDTEEQWQLKKDFMVTHMHKFSKERLMCLAELLSNIKYLGCTYSQEIMDEVARLSKDVEIRKKYNKTLPRPAIVGDETVKKKRTLVSASKAASQMVLGQPFEPDFVDIVPKEKEQNLKQKKFNSSSYEGRKNMVTSLLRSITAEQERTLKNVIDSLDTEKKSSENDSLATGSLEAGKKSSENGSRATGSSDAENKSSENDSLPTIKTERLDATELSNSVTKPSEDSSQANIITDNFQKTTVKSDLHTSVTETINDGCYPNCPWDVVDHYDEIAKVPLWDNVETHKKVDIFNDFEWKTGPCKCLVVILIGNEHPYTTLQRNSAVWKRPLTLIWQRRKDGNWFAGITFDGVCLSKVTGQSKKVVKYAASEFAIWLLQSSFYTLQMNRGEVAEYIFEAPTERVRADVSTFQINAHIPPSSDAMTPGNCKDIEKDVQFVKLADLANLDMSNALEKCQVFEHMTSIIDAYNNNRTDERELVFLKEYGYAFYKEIEQYAKLTVGLKTRFVGASGRRLLVIYKKDNFSFHPWKTIRHLLIADNERSSNKVKSIQNVKVIPPNTFSKPSLHSEVEDCTLYSPSLACESNVAKANPVFVIDRSRGRRSKAVDSNLIVLV